MPDLEELRAPWDLRDMWDPWNGYGLWGLRDSCHLWGLWDLRDPWGVGGRVRRVRPESPVGREEFMKSMELVGLLIDLSTGGVAHPSSLGLLVSKPVFQRPLATRSPI